MKTKKVSGAWSVAAEKPNILVRKGGGSEHFFTVCTHCCTSGFLLTLPHLRM